MIEQTKLVIGKYLYQPLVSIMEDEEEKLPSFIEFDVIRKRAIKKRDLPAGLPCGLFIIIKSSWNMAEHSYVIDLQDVIDMNEFEGMIRNSLYKFNEKFEYRRFGTLVSNK